MDEEESLDFPMAKAKDLSYAFMVKGGLGEQTEEESAREVQWVGKFGGSADEFVYPSLSKATIMDKNRLARMKAGLDHEEPANRALDRTLKLALEDFLPPLEEGRGERSGVPSENLIARLASMGVEFGEDEIKSPIKKKVSSSSGLAGLRVAREAKAKADLAAKEPVPAELHEQESFTSLKWAMKDLHGKLAPVDPVEEAFKKDVNQGEVSLRRALKTSYEQNLVVMKEESRKLKVENKIKRRTSSVQMHIEKTSGGRRSSSAVFGTDTRTAMDIYSSLVIRFKDKEKAQQFNLEDEDDEDHDESIFHTEVSALDKQLNNIAAQNAEAAGNVKMGTANEHLHAGLTYYRVTNALHYHNDEKERVEREIQQMRVLLPTELRRPTIRITDAMKRQQKRIAELAGTAGSPEKEQEYISAARLANHNASPAELMRIRRVMGSRYIGYDVPEVLDEAGFGPPIGEKDTGKGKGKGGRNEDSDYDSDEDEFDGDGGSNDESSVDSENIPDIDYHKKIGGKRALTKDAKNAHANDVLLASQLKKGVLPENIFRRKPGHESTVSLDLSHYGLGDEMGLCLGAALGNYDGLDALILRGNRLSHKSVPLIVENMGFLVQLDLSQNNLHGPGFRAITTFFKLSAKGNRLLILDVSSSKLDSKDVTAFFQVLRDCLSHGVPLVLKELNMAHNEIRSDACGSMKDFLLCSRCPLMALELGWNSLGVQGAEILGEMLRKNTCLHELDLRANNIGDFGAQNVATSLVYNRTLKELNLAQNSIAGHACFVFSKVLNEHPAMTKLDLTANPLGDAGARSLFRTILRGLRCFIIMRDCVFPIDHKSFDHTNPSATSPYTLDMSVPYQAAILNEMCVMIGLQEDECHFEGGITLELNNKTTTYNVAPSMDRVLNDKRTGKKWEVPREGIVKVDIHHRVKMPSINSIISKHGLMVLLLVVIHARTETDRTNWLRLLTMDAWFSCEQVQHMLDRLSQERLLGAGSLNLQMVLLALWNRIVDVENKFDFICANLSLEGRQELANSCTFEKFRFSWLNPTGRWRLDLSRRVHRDLFMQLTAVNNWQSSRSQEAKRDDTSQNGNWNNFRNETYRGESFVMDKEWLQDIPSHGTVEFDFVSTERPNSGITSRPGTGNTSRPGTADSTGSGVGEPGTGAETISVEDMDDLKRKLGLSVRRRIPKSRAIMAVMELQLAATKYFFSSEDVISLLDCFSEDLNTQCKVVISLFCRLLDLENFHIIARYLSTPAAQSVAESLGWLNIMNPLHPAGDYKMRLQYQDERCVGVYMLQLGASEGDPIRDNTKSEVNLIEAYSSLGRLKDDTHARNLLFSYKEIGEAKSPPIWNLRRDLIRHFLIGTAPISRNVYLPIKHYKELKDSNALKTGPLDLQYREYQKELKRKARKNKAKMMLKGNLMLSKLKKIQSAPLPAL